MDQLSECGLSLDEAVRDVELPAEVGQPDDQLNGVDVVGNDHQLGLLLLDELGDMVESELEMVWLGILDFLLCIRVEITLSSELGLCDESSLALLGVLRGVLLQQPEEDVGLVLIQGSGELSNCGWDLDPCKQDPLLSLEGDVLGPLDKSGEISCGLDAISYSEVSGLLFKERIGFLLYLFGSLFCFDAFGLYEGMCTMFVIRNNNIKIYLINLIKMDKGKDI